MKYHGVPKVDLRQLIVFYLTCFEWSVLRCKKSYKVDLLEDFYVLFYLLHFVTEMRSSSQSENGLWKLSSYIRINFCMLFYIAVRELVNNRTCSNRQLPDILDVISETAFYSWIFCLKYFDVEVTLGVIYTLSWFEGKD